MSCNPETVITSAEIANAKSNFSTIKTVVEGGELSTITPDGKAILTLQGALDSCAQGNITTFSAAATYSNVTDWVDVSGIVYRPIPSFLPIGPEAFDSSKWIVAQGGNQRYTVPDYATLSSRLNDEYYKAGDVVTVASIATPGINGQFTIFVASGAEYLDDKGITITANRATSVIGMLVAVRNEFRGIVHTDWFGAAGSNSEADATQNTLALNYAYVAANNIANTFSAKVQWGEGVYFTDGPVNVDGFGGATVGVMVGATILKAATGFSGYALLWIRHSDNDTVMKNSPVRDISINCNLKDCHGLVYVNGYDQSGLGYVNCYGARADKQALRIEGSGSPAISQTMTFINCIFKKGEIGTNETVYIERLQEAVFIECKSWNANATVDTGTGYPFRFVDCRSITMLQCSYVSTVTYGLSIETVERPTRSFIIRDPDFENCLGGPLRAVATGVNLITGLKCEGTRIETPAGGGFYLDGVTGSYIETQFTNVEFTSASTRNLVMAYQEITMIDAGTFNTKITTPNSAVPRYSIENEQFQVRSASMSHIRTEDANTSLETVLTLGCNIGGTKTIKKVYIDSPDSAKTGYRQLIIEN